MKKRSLYFIVMAVGIASVVACLMKAWMMALDFTLFLIISQMIVERSKTEEQVDNLIGKIIIRGLIPLLVICLAIGGSHWIGYFAFAIAGLILPIDRSMALGQSHLNFSES